MLKKLIRDNSFSNLIIRNCLRFINEWFGVPKNYLNKFRVYGKFKLEVNKVKFNFYAEADDFIANDLYYGLGYELGEFRLLKQLLPNCKNFIDVGANTGIFSIYAATSNRNLKIISFEPHPSNYSRLCKNVQLNSLENVNLTSFAVGANEDVVKFTVPADLRISATASVNEAFTKNFHKIDFKEIQVKQVALDIALEHLQINSNDLIKIDVEYYELDVLKGAKQILRDKRPMVILEILNYNSLTAQFPEMKNRINSDYALEIFTFLKDLNYFGYTIQENGISLVNDLATNENRNFLFMPYKLSNSDIAFDALLIKS